MKSLVMRRMVSGLCPPAGDAFGAVCTSRRITMGLPDRDCCRLCKKGRGFLQLCCHRPVLSALPPAPGHRGALGTRGPVFP